MKVLLVNDYGTPTGGAELQMLEVREALRDRGHDARLFASSARDFDAPSLADYSCPGTTSPLRTLVQSANPAAAYRLRQVIRDFRPDVVHVRLFLTQLSPLILPVLRDVPAVAHVAWYRAVCPVGTKLLPDGSPCQVRAGKACLSNGCVPARDWAPLMAQRAAMRRWWDAFDRVIALSDPVARELDADGIGPAIVLGNAVRERPARPPLDGPPTVGFAGRLERSKGVDVLIRAFERVPEGRLVIAGDGPDAGRIAALVAASPARDRIDLLGRVERDDLERVLASAWVQAVPSTWAEPFGNVAAEALMRGTAVVATDGGGLPDIVRDAVSGYIVPRGDEEALAGRLTRLLGDRALAEGMGAAGRRDAIDRLGMDAYLDRLLAIYEEAGAERPRPRPVPARVEGGPRFSIVIPTCDRPRELARCLAAIDRLDYPRDEYEVIVVDDGGREPALPDVDGVRVVRQANAGPAAARNRGAALARGRWIAFTDDDCEPSPGWLHALERPLAGGAAAVAGRASNAAAGNDCATAGQLLIDHLLTYYNHDSGDARFGTSNNFAVDREALAAAGGFDESFERAAGEDRELVHRLRADGHRIAYEPNAVVAHHHRQDVFGFWRQHYGYGRAAVHYRERIDDDVPLEPPRFYRDLVRAPTAGLSALLVLSQVANAAGFARESLAGRRS